MKLSEAHIEHTCTAWLELDGWRGLKTNPVSNRARGAGFGELGMADYLYIRYLARPCIGHGCSGEQCGPAQGVKAEVMFIEWKSQRGNPKPHQLAWHQAERARGALTLIAGEDFEASIETFQRWYRESGLMRRKI